MTAELVGGSRDGRRIRVTDPPPPGIYIPAEPMVVKAWLSNSADFNVSHIVTETWLFQGIGMDDAVAYYTLQGDAVGQREAAKRLHRVVRR